MGVAGAGLALAGTPPGLRREAGGYTSSTVWLAVTEEVSW